jgi:hypothetical protein
MGQARERAPKLFGELCVLCRMVCEKGREDPGSGCKGNRPFVAMESDSARKATPGFDHAMKRLRR